ncbi:YegP family protein [Phyllobacterium sp. 21LDTY02-6]|uniref:YegP family protein n=1 Tax=Phyllobacterium sp. 21LDTY02-6 TaxID=2944903 RepID=UPI003531E0A2
MFEIMRATGGYYWRLKASNGETICHSEVYTTKQSAEGGVSAAKRIIPTASVIDRT